MTRIYDMPLSVDFGTTILRANGVVASGDPYPAEGISNRLEIVGGALQATVYQDDTLTYNGRRAEVDIGVFPANSGVCWSTVDFMLPGDWSYNKLIMMGSWYPTPDGGDGTKHVTIGLRLLGPTLLVIVPDSLPGETTTGKTVARMDLERGRWYSLCIHAGLATDLSGFREVYVDGVPILREFNIPTTYIDAVGPYFKIGPYDGGHNNDFGMLRLYYRNARMWTGIENFQAVMDRVPRMPRRLLGN